MKEGAVGTHLHIVPTKNSVSPKSSTERSDAPVPLWMDQISHEERQATGKRGTRATQGEQKSREARLEALRARVQSGTYRVDSLALAESMLKNESHFMGASR